MMAQGIVSIKHSKTAKRPFDFPSGSHVGVFDKEFARM